MFNIRVRFVEVNQHIKALSAAEFDADAHDFCGQVEVNFDGHLVNDWFYEGEITEKAIEEGSFSEEWVLLWLENLLDAATSLYSDKVATVPLVERPGELRFLSLGGVLEVKLFVPEIKWDKFGSEVIEPEHMEWDTRSVDQNEFTEKIIKCAEDTLNLITNEFPSLVASEAVTSFKHTIEDAKIAYSTQVEAMLTVGAEWSDYENCIIGDEPGLKNLIHACEIALKRGEYYGKNLGRYAGVKKLNRQALEKPSGATSSRWNNVLIGVGYLLLLALAVVGAVAIFKWLFN